MKQIHTLIIGAGQAGLAASYCLSDAGIPHVILERGAVANSWRTERWDSLTLLTPNWQSRLPGFGYRGPDPHGYMTMGQITGYLESYARFCHAPIEERTRVCRARAGTAGYLVETDRGDWCCQNLIVATGACNIANVPGFAPDLPPGIEQLTPLQYRNPAQLAPGGVLVVGASATGLQLAQEIRAAGYDVVLSAGEHIRMPRHYRGRDIQWWMDRIGIHKARVDEAQDIARLRHLPSLQLLGSHARQFMDLNAAQDAGIELVGRLTTVRDGIALFSGSLTNHAALSDLKMNRLLRQIDDWAEMTGTGADHPSETFAPTRVPDLPRLNLPLTDGRIRTVIWATGYRPDHSWLDLPVFDARGRLVHSEGQVAPGLFVLGLPFQRRRNSALIDGVGADAWHVGSLVTRNLTKAA